MIEERGFSQQLFYRALGTRRCRAPHVRRRDCAHDNARCHGSHDALPARFDARPCSSQHRLYWHGLSVACSCPCNQSLSQDSTTCCYQAFQASQKRRYKPNNVSCASMSARRCPWVAMPCNLLYRAYRRGRASNARPYVHQRINDSPASPANAKWPRHACESMLAPHRLQAQSGPATPANRRQPRHTYESMLAPHRLQAQSGPATIR